MSPVEDRVRAAMAAAADQNLAAPEIRSAPPLRLPYGLVPGVRSRRGFRGPVRWAVPVAAAAAVTAVAVSLVLAQGAQHGGSRSQPAASASPAVPAAPTGPGGAPRYWVAAGPSTNHISAGDDATGKVLANLTLPGPRDSTSFVTGITAADDDQTFAAAVVTYPGTGQHLNQATGTVHWYEVRLAPGTAAPARISSLPVKPLTVHGGVAYELAVALSGSGRELALTMPAASGRLAVQVVSTATGQPVRSWTASGLSGSWVALTWVNQDRQLAVETLAEPHSDSTDIVRELDLSGSATGSLLADGKVVWDVTTPYPSQTRLQACAKMPVELGVTARQISADGTRVGCEAIFGPPGNPTMSFVTYPLARATTDATKATVFYQETNTATKGVDDSRIFWINPSGDALIGGWLTKAKGNPLAADPNSLRMLVMSHGKNTPLRFPPGFGFASYGFVTF